MENTEQTNQTGISEDLLTLNQIGYLPFAPKYFCISSDTLPADEFFQITDLNSGKIVLQERLLSPAINDLKYSGKNVYRGDFSDFSLPGNYIIKIKNIESTPFQISTTMYNDLFLDSFRIFSLLRANVEINDPKTGMIHPAGHLQDFSIDNKDFSGGWYNAGDYGKWTHCATIVIANLLWLYLLNPLLQSDSLDIPESGNGIPDILDEARWGIEWLFKMQNSDGSVYHKIDTEPDFSWGKPPEKDSLYRSPKWTDRYGTTPATIDAADFCAVMSLAFRTFHTIDKTFATRCRKAALLSWEWLTAHMDNPQTDPYYVDHDPSREIFWAAAEIFILTHQEKGGTIIKEFSPSEIHPPAWNSPEFFGSLTLCFDPLVPNELRSIQRTALFNSGDFLIHKAAQNAYGHVLTDFWWSSNAYVTGTAQLLLAAFIMSKNKKYLYGALEQVNYILGRNALGKSFVTGYGKNSVMHPYHWSYYVYKILLPGWISGGPNRYSAGADPLLKALQKPGIPPALCYVDRCGADGSWASNEGTIGMTSSLMFIAGLLSDTSE